MEKITFTYKVETLTAVKYIKVKGKNYTDIEFGGWGVALPKKLKLQVGDKVEIYEDGGHLVGIFKNGKVVAFKSKQQKEKEDREWLEKNEKDKLRKFNKNKKRYDKVFAALPPIFQKRVQLFRDNGKNWRVDWEGYELAVCEEAVALADHFKTPQALQAFKEEPYEKQSEQYKQLNDGHSGNTWSFALALAELYLIKPDDVYNFHGAACPLVGCEDYGCVHPRP